MDVAASDSCLIRACGQLDDSGTIADLLQACLAETADPPDVDKGSVERLRAYQAADPEAFVLAVRDRAPVGVCACSQADNSDVVLHFLAVHPSARRRGLGRRLNSHVGFLASKWGARRARTAASIDNRNGPTVSFLEACGWRARGGAGIRMWRRLERLPQVDPHPDYAIRTYCDGDADDFVRIRNAAFEADDPGGRLWVRADFEAEYLDSPYFQPDRVFFAVNDGRPVGTTTAWTATHEDREVGLIHWVAVDPAHRRRGLGHLLTATAMGKLKAMGCTEAILNTNEKFASAVRMYGRLGFSEYRRRAGFEREYT